MLRVYHLNLQQNGAFGNIHATQYDNSFPFSPYFLIAIILRYFRRHALERIYHICMYGACDMMF